MNVAAILSENKKRLAEFKTPYDQLTGQGSMTERIDLSYDGLAGHIDLRIPKPMADDVIVQGLIQTQSIAELLLRSGESVNDASISEVEQYLTQLRLDNDFEFWAITCATIQHKMTKRPVSFQLNRPQRRLVAKLEAMRLAEAPIRLILLKARQWGGSTLIQMYMAWIQLRLKTAWHSAIVADVDDQARNIRNMYERLSKTYPEEVGKITWRPYAGGQKARIIHQRDCIVGIGSAQNPEALRSYDFAMLHLSEVGLWKDTEKRTAADLAQSLQATVPDIAGTLVVLESTAKGIGNFFHKQWLNALRGTSIYSEFFVPWFEIEMYQKDVPDYESFVKSWGEYEQFLWELGATIEGIYWYVSTKIGYDYDDWRMKSEYPSTADEAFQSSGQRVFAPMYVKKAEKNCTKPEFIGDVFPSIKGRDALKNPRIEKSDKGRLSVWALPDKSVLIKNRYCVFVDIGGRTEKADYSIIKVFDRYWMMDGGVPEVVAVWHGHIDQDLLAWKAAQISYLYNNALLAVESNSLEKKRTEGDHFLTILHEIADYYDNIYAREDHERIQGEVPRKYGFHTNSATKPMIINALNGALRDDLYTEKDIRACHEMDTYEVKPDGSYGAISGTHDDHVMATAGGVWLCYDMEPPAEVQFYERNTTKGSIQSEATI